MSVKIGLVEGQGIVSREVIKTDSDGQTLGLEKSDLLKNLNPQRGGNKNGDSIVNRIWTILLCVVWSFSMSACAENNLGQMYIEEALIRANGEFR